MTERAILKRIAKNYLEWCNTKEGPPFAKGRLAALFDAPTIVALRPLIEEEMKKRGWNLPKPKV